MWTERARAQRKRQLTACARVRSTSHDIINKKSSNRKNKEEDCFNFAWLVVIKVIRSNIDYGSFVGTCLHLHRNLGHRRRSPALLRAQEQKQIVSLVKISKNQIRKLQFVSFQCDPSDPGPDGGLLLAIVSTHFVISNSCSPVVRLSIFDSWLCCYMSQMNPLIGPVLNQRSLFAVKYFWVSKPLVWFEKNCFRWWYARIFFSRMLGMSP